MRGAISDIATLRKRFAVVLRHCSGETILSIDRLHPEIALLEKPIDLRFP